MRAGDWLGEDNLNRVTALLYNSNIERAEDSHEL